MRPGMKNIGELTEELRAARIAQEAAEDAQDEAELAWNAAVESSQLELGDFMALHERAWGCEASPVLRKSYGYCPGWAGEPCSCGLRGCPMDAKPEAEAPKADPWDAFLPDGWEWRMFGAHAGWTASNSEMTQGGCVWDERAGPTAVSLLGEAEATRLHAIVRARNGDWGAVLPSDDWMWEDDGEGGHCLAKAMSPAYVAYDHWGHFARTELGDEEAERLCKLVALRNEVDPPNLQVSRVTAVKTYNMTMHSEDVSRAHLVLKKAMNGEAIRLEDVLRVDPNPPGAGE